MNAVYESILSIETLSTRSRISGMNSFASIKNSTIVHIPYIKFIFGYICAFHEKM
jgi:hypothetical protein